MKIEHPLVKGKIKEIHPKIYCVTVDDHYDRAMLFCRYQEFYESPSKKFRGKYFTWAQYMRYYKDFWKKDTFTYPIDWTGYNIPCNIVQKANHMFSGETEYDKIMNDIYFYCATNAKFKNGNKQTDWYLIGASGKDIHTMDHELAHGLYFTDQEYKKNVSKLIKKILKRDYEKFKKILISMGYLNKKNIIDDEIQAFLSTGLYNQLDVQQLKKYEKDFKNNFKKFKTI